MKVRKKPVTVNAWQWQQTPESLGELMMVDGFGEAWLGHETSPDRKTISSLRIRTLEGPHNVLPDSWIIKGVRGEFYSCRADIFAETYEILPMEDNVSDMACTQIGKPKFNLENWLYCRLGSDWCGNVSPPLNHRKTYTSDGYVVCLNNDGFETWIGSPDTWYWHTKNSEFRKIAWWHLRVWIFVDWFGLRSWLWYKLLHRKAEEIKRFGKMMRERND